MGNDLGFWRRLPSVAFGVAIGAVSLLLLARCGGDTAPIPPPATIQTTSGGGEVQSENFRGHIRMGAPQPMGRAASESFGVRVGPITP